MYDAKLLLIAFLVAVVVGLMALLALDRKGKRLAVFGAFLLGASGANLPFGSIYSVIVKGGGVEGRLTLWPIDAIILILLLYTILRPHAAKPVAGYGKLLGAGVAMFLFELCGTAFSVVPMNAFMQSITTGKSVLLAWLVYRLIEDRAGLMYACAGLVASLTIHAGFAYLQWINQGPLGLSVLGEVIPNRHNLAYLSDQEVGGLAFGKYISGLTGGISIFGATTAISVMVVLMVGITCRKQSLVLLAFLGIGAIIIASVRSSMAGIAVSGLYVIILITRRRESRSGLLGYGMVAAGIFVLTAIFFGVLSRNFSMEMLIESFESRMFLNRHYLTIVMSNPLILLFGIGPNSSYALVEKDLFGNFMYAPAHNIIVLYLVESGLFGLMFLATLVTLVVRDYRRSTKYYNDLLSLAIAHGCMASLIAIGTQSMFTWIIRSNQVFTMVWLVIALLYATIRVGVYGAAAESVKPHMASELPIS